MVSVVELVGGALLLVGLASRLAALPLIASMAVAIVTAQREQVHGLPDLFGLVEWTYLALLLWVAVAGPGKVSLDHLFRRHTAAREESPLDSRLSAKAA
jgi:putative oxidoreductase